MVEKLPVQGVLLEPGVVCDLDNPARVRAVPILFEFDKKVPGLDPVR